jgi:hypothetical protein
LQSRKKSGKSRLDEEKAATNLQLRTKHNLVVVAMTASTARHLKTLDENEPERRRRWPDEGYIYVEAPGLGMS